MPSTFIMVIADQVETALLEFALSKAIRRQYRLFQPRNRIGIAPAAVVSE